MTQQNNKHLLTKEKTQKHDKTNWHRTKGDKEYLYQRAGGYKWQQDRHPETEESYFG